MESYGLERTPEDIRKIQAGRRVAEQLRRRKPLPDGASASKGRRPERSGGVEVPALEFGGKSHSDAAQAPEQATAPCAANRRGELRLPSYNGAVEPHAFLAQVELAAKFGGWSPAETAVRAALALEGAALRALEDLRADEREDWAKLRESLHLRFGAGDRKEAAGEELATRERRASEPLGAFAMDLRSLARQGYPEFEHAQQEELARRAFLRGIRPYRLREHIRLAAPASLSEALREAERAEPILAEHRGERAERSSVARGRSVGEPSRGQGYPSRLGLDPASEFPRRRRGQGPPDNRCNVLRPEDSVPQPPLN